jgi:amino acid adenylation domain-containing protein
MHHIASDGWSMGIFLRELDALYRAFTRGEGDPLPALPVQYADYALWQRSKAAAGELEMQGQYWERALQGPPAVLELPIDRPRPAQQDYAGAVVRFELDADLSKGLKALSRRAGTTLFMTVLAGWMAVLARLARQEDVVVGTPVANRGHAQVEGLIGFFVNALALRVGVKGDLTVRDLLERVKRCALEAQQHQDIPFEQVVERVRPERSLAHSPIFQAVFTWQNKEGRTLNLPGLEVRVSEAAAHVVSKFDLILAMWDKPAGIAGMLEYATSLFDEATVRRMGGYLRTMLAAMVEDEGRKIGTIKLLSPEERRQVLEGWNDTQALYPAVCVHRLVEQQAQRTPQAIAAIFERESLTYEELNSRTNQLAHFLVRKGIRPGCRVALCVERGLPMVIGILGVIKAGGAYVPLDPAYPRRHLEKILRDAAPEILLVDRAGQAVFAAEVAPDKVLRIDGVNPLWAAMPEQNIAPESIGLDANDLVYVIYTSGSTGVPKGVMVRHLGLVNIVTIMQKRWANYRLERMTQFASMAFDASAKEIFYGLASGLTLVLRDDRWLTESEKFWALCAEEQINYLNLPARLWQSMVRGREVEIPECVRLIVVGGESVESDAVREWVWREGYKPTLMNAYGPTEATINATLGIIADEERWKNIGPPISNTQIYILDERGEPVPIGVVGEIYIGGTGVACGYLNRPELTAERFVADPYTTMAGARMYRTGDLGLWRGDGTIEFYGRNDFQVKVRGYRVELGEIEARLREVRGVSEAVVVLKEDVAGEKRLVAYVVGLEGENVDA